MFLKNYKLKCIIILIKSISTQTMAFIIRYLFVNDKTENDLGKDKNEILYILFKCNFEPIVKFILAVE